MVTLLSLVLHWPLWSTFSYSNLIMIIVARSCNELRLLLFCFSKYFKSLGRVLRMQQLWCIGVVRTWSWELFHFPKGSLTEWNILLFFNRHIIGAGTNHWLWCNLLQLPQILKGHEPDVRTRIGHTWASFRRTLLLSELWCPTWRFQCSEYLRVESHFLKDLWCNCILNRFAFDICNQVTWHRLCAEWVGLCVSNVTGRRIVLKGFWNRLISNSLRLSTFLSWFLRWTLLYNISPLWLLSFLICFLFHVLLHRLPCARFFTIWNGRSIYS